MCYPYISYSLRGSEFDNIISSHSMATLYYKRWSVSLLLTSYGNFALLPTLFKSYFVP